jgi:hypothetical protein
MSFVFQKGDRIGVQLMNNNNLMDAEAFEKKYNVPVIGRTVVDIAERIGTDPCNIAASRPDHRSIWKAAYLETPLFPRWLTDGLVVYRQDSADRLVWLAGDDEYEQASSWKEMTCLKPITKNAAEKLRYECMSPARVIRDRLAKNNPEDECSQIGREHTGNKYHRRISSVAGDTAGTVVDVYCVIEAFAVSCPARQHALKKLLCSGIRGKNDSVQDLIEARDAVERAITLERQRLKAGE